MLDRDNLPGYLQRMEESFQTKRRGFIMTFNLYDYVCIHGIPPCRLRYFLPTYLRQQGYELIVSFSSSTGYEILDDFSDEERSKALERQFERHSGLKVRDTICQRMGRRDSHEQCDEDTVTDLREVLPGLTRLLRQDSLKVALIVEYAHHLAPATQGMAAFSSPEQVFAVETFHSWGIDDRIRATENRVILFALEGHIHELLVNANSGYEQLTVGLPDETERRRFIQQCLDVRSQGNSEFGELASDVTPDLAAMQTSGLRYVDLEGLFRTAGARNTEVSREDIRRCKAQAIRQMGGELLEVLEPTCGFSEIACLPHVIGYLAELNRRLQMGYIDIPRAILFAGVPGVGKSYLVRAWASELGYNCIAMRNIRSQWVGESERNMERFFNCVLALQPVLCFIDEIDQALGQRGQGGDSGTSERMLARIWEFMALEEHRGKIIWVGASNRPDMLDPATIDRFGIVIPFLHPTPDQIPQLLPVLAKQLGHEFADDVRFDEFASLPCMRSVTARALLDIISMAALQNGEDESGIDMEHLLAAAKAYRPNYNPLQHAYIALVSIRMTSFTHLLPWMDSNGKRNDTQIPGYLSDIVDDATGEVDEDKLNSELAELATQLQRENLTRLF